MICLPRRAGAVGVGAKDAAVAGLGLEKLTAAGAAMEVPAGVRRHRRLLPLAAQGASDRRGPRQRHEHMMHATSRVPVLCARDALSRGLEGRVVRTSSRSGSLVVMHGPRPCAARKHTSAAIRNSNFARRELESRGWGGGPRSPVSLAVRAPPWSSQAWSRTSSCHAVATVRLMEIRAAPHVRAKHGFPAETHALDTTQTIRPRLRAFLRRFRAVYRSGSVPTDARLRVRASFVSATAWSRGPSSRPC